MKLRHVLISLSIIFAAVSFVVLSKKVTGERWGFVGYQYKWSKDYVEKTGFKSEEKCVDFGNQWLSKQTPEEALFTCSLNSRHSGTPGLDTADKICEYGVRGFIRCRE